VYPKVSGLSHNEINNSSNKHSLRSDTKGYDGKTHYVDSQNSDTTAPSDSCTICSSSSIRSVRKLLDIPSYTLLN